MTFFLCIVASPARLPCQQEEYVVFVDVDGFFICELRAHHIDYFVVHFFSPHDTWRRARQAYRHRDIQTGIQVHTQGGRGLWLIEN